MDALLQLNQNSSIDESRFLKSKEIMRQAGERRKNFPDDVSDAISEQESVKKADPKEKEKKKLMDACVETESIFVGMMLKQMRNTIHKGEILNGGQTEEIFSDMLYDQYSLSLSKTANLGIAKQMYQQMSKAI
jgi:peptidoglycan hydrolase FlgJ